MPAHVCMLCRVVYIAGSLPASHGVCAPCLLADDPGAAEVFAEELARQPPRVRPEPRHVRRRENSEGYERSVSS